MNCENFEEMLYDYLDGALSSDQKMVAEEHLFGCGACRQALENEQLIAETLSTEFTRAVEAVALDADARRAIATAVTARQPAATNSRPQAESASFLRIFLRFAAAAAVGLAAIWSAHRFEQRAGPGASATAAMVPIHTSFSTSAYTFYNQGSLLVDALTTDPVSIDGALLAEK